MKKSIRITVVLFALAFLLPNLHRAFSGYGVERVQMFLLSNEVISVQWYVKMLCQHISFLCTMLLVCSILKPVARHIGQAPWVGHNAVQEFVVMWWWVFAIISATAAIDVIHFIIAFQRIEWLFLLQNFLFLLLASYKIYYTLKK